MKINKLLILFSVIFLVGCQTSQLLVTIKINDHVIKAEVVKSQAALQQGLSGRTSLAADQGMLFVFDKPGTHSFWMKDMKFPLDIIWLNNGQVVEIWANAPAPAPGQAPASHMPLFSADMVLEIPAGQAAILGLSVGRTVQMPPALDLQAASR